MIQNVTEHQLAELEATLRQVAGGRAAAKPDHVQELTRRVESLERRLAESPDPNSINLLVFDGSRDKLLAAFVMATGSAACGFRVNMFFTFWATAALRKNGPQFGRKSLVERAFGWMLPRGFAATKLSRMDMCGVGRCLMSREMRKKNVADLNELLSTAAELDVKISVCEMSMQLMGIRREELIDYPELSYCGVASFADLAAKANTTLFI
ncbi:MAG: DsrE/DsrF/DrsH-like family protein [Planctomycetaceae bacterium]|nr:DsrE/DsrF/DrsH-like family protein [Planctomycetaceae bacterium]